MKRIIFSFVALVYCTLGVFAQDVFSANTIEGVRMVFKVTDEENKECKVGDDSYNAAINSFTMGTVTIPSTVNGYTVRSIGYYAFYSCRLVEEFVIPEGVTQIESFAFMDCTGITDITLPKSLVYLYDSAFENCYGLTSVTIPKNVYATQGMIFCNSSFPKCINLEEIKVDPKNPYLESIDNVLYLRNHQGILQYPAGKTDTSYEILEGTTGGLFSGVFSGLQYTKSIKVPEGITYINGGVFSESINLEEIELPSSITTFDGYNMIYGCTRLTKVISHIMNPWSVDSRVFQVSEGVHTSATLYVPKGTKSLYEAADGWKNFKNIIEMEPDEPEPTIIEFADADVKAICVENWDTDGDGELSEEEAAAVTTIGNVFQRTGITSFDELRYFTGLTSIEDMAFANCSQLTSLIIPRSVEIVGGGLFYMCDALTSVSVEKENSWLDSRDGCNAIIKTATNTLLDGCKTTIIPNGITAIGDMAFYHIHGMTSLTIPNTVTSIGLGGLFGLQDLTSLTIPKSVISLGDEVIGNTNALETLVVETGNPVYDSREGCNAIIETATNKLVAACKTTVIPESVTAIGYCAYDVHPITTLNIPANVIDIDELAVRLCNSLAVITVNEANNVYDTRNDCNAIMETASEQLLIGCKNTVIPEDTRSIGKYAFMGCEELQEIVLPKTVTTIGTEAFEDCTNLTKVTAYMQEPPMITENTFTNRKNATLYVPDGCRATYALADYWKDFNPIVEMEPEVSNFIEFADANVKAICVENWDTNGDGELSEEEAAAVSDLGNYFYKSEIIESFDELKFFTGLKIIPSYAFQGCINLSSVVIPVSVKTIDMFAFEGCKKLKDVNLPQGLSKLEYFAFGSCESLESVIIPEGVAEIGSHAFRGCSALKSLELQEGLVKIEQAAFQNCTMLSSIVIPSTVESINTSAFSGCEKLETVTMTSGVKSIGTFCFQDCTSLTEVTFSKDLESIWDFAFDGCTQLKEVDLPEGLSTLGSNAFSDCESLVSVNIPGSLTEIGSSAFLSCSAMTSLTLHEGLVDIGRNAFQNCVMLPSVVIPSTVEGIAVSAFANCERLAMVVMSKNVKIIGSFAFQDCTSLGAITLPETLQTIENFSFDGCSQLTSVTARMEEPVDIDYYTFTNRTNATLYVPIGSKALYQAADYWKEFKNIIEMDEEGTLRGDVNGDKLVNGTDLVTLTCMILGQQEENAAADVYDDGLVNGTDYVALVDIILNFSASSARSMAARSTSNNLLMAKVGIEPFSIAAGESQTMTITLDNPNMDVTLIQFDMTLPEGLKLKTDEDGYAVEMTGRTTWKDHTVYIGSLSEGSVRTILASGKNALIDGNSGGILNLTLVADENYDGGDIMLHHILCASPDTQECWPYDYTLHLASSSTTRIDGIEEGQTSDIYNVSGQRLSAPRKGINIINGKKVVIK